MKKYILSTIWLIMVVCCFSTTANSTGIAGAPIDSLVGPLGEWPEFIPVGFITAPHPDNPNYQTHLYGDWGSIVGEEFIFLQEGKIKLLYHSYHETYMTEHPHEEEVLTDWALGYDPVTKIKYTPLVCPGGPVPGPAWDHTDTPGYLRHPLTGEHLLYNTVRPGTKYLNSKWDGLAGAESAIQVATSVTSPAIGIPFTQSYENALVAELWWEQGWNNNGIIKGGLSEPTPVWVPHLGTAGKVRLFYRGLHGSPGSYWNWRISYADSDDGKTNWVKNPTPTFDPSDPDNPAYQWTQPPPDGFNFRGAWQAHCTGDARADGVHMVLTVSNQNYALGGRIAYYWSPDWGDTWIGHPDNPIIVAGTDSDGVPASGFQRTPTLLIDEVYNRYILAYNAGHDANVHWQRRTYLAIASRPEASQLTLCGDVHDGDLVLEWSAVPGAWNYWVFGTDNDAWFEPGMISPYQYRLHVCSPETTSWFISNGLGNPNHNWTYLILAVDAAEQEITRSTRYGEYDFSTQIRTVYDSLW